MTIRNSITQSHDRVWTSLSQPGPVLTSAERVQAAAMTRSARSCNLCQARKAALSANAVTGEHENIPDQADKARVELIHKLVTDPGRITAAWVDNLLSQGMTDVEYIEIAALVSSVLVVDTFHAAMELPLRELPDVGGDNPTGNRPRTAVKQDSYVPMVPTDGLTDDYTDLYDTEFWVPNVQRAFSLVPDATRLAQTLMRAHYFPYEMVPRYTDADHNYAISKTQIELVASRVSLYNDCFY